MHGIKNNIRFVLNDEIVSISFSDGGEIHPDTNLLYYLRYTGYLSVKEGCGEGDCGACTVVIASVQNGKLVYKAINACLVLLPMVHGCQVITTEHLSSFVDGQQYLHPVQKAMIDQNGSQCGYCTPGIVMSLFALWKNISNPSERIIRSRLAGNLCRCTGYQPIIEAAMKFGNQNQDDKFSKSGADIIQKLVSIQQESKDIDIQTKKLRYFKPASLKKALEIRKEFPDASILSGSTDIGVMLNKQKSSISVYLDISGLQELKTVESTQKHLRMGACISLKDMDESLGTKFPAIHEMISVFGSHQIRNLATPGGNIAGASPIGDLPPVMMACECIVELQSKSARRSMPLEDFITGYHETAIAEDELLTAVIIPFNQDKSIIRSYKVSKRKDVDISSVSAGFRLKLDQEGNVKDIRLYYGGMAASTGRARKAEKFLLGKEWSEENALQAAEVAQTDFEPISDARCEADTRRIMAGNLIIRFWEDSTKKTNG